ncbi:peptidase M48 [Sulfuriferula sp. AH1]|uniref:M48 family metalloprotease n=1 Tax=Sulfuriferula sp. AH1 TaxID=1985873 RepID=UPI000B3B8ABD|nr:M48 family metalloprotease [Sulfuriferula sp. AH1]ARU32963.1 peptidase M48 [Sulfuriferula sp. AH1]
MKLIILILCLVSQSVTASELPDLGDISQSSFSSRDEARVGSEIMRDIYANPQYYDDAELTDYLNNLGSRLVAASSESQRSFQFFVLKDNTLNAFALPGGYIGVHTGLIEAAQNESELAGVLGHEIAHVTQHHLARMIESQNRSILPSLAALAVAILAARSNPQVAGGAIAATQAVSIQKQLDFSRDNEREADRIGMQIMSAAGFDPNAMATFFERLQKYSRLYDNNAPAYLRTHPLTSERIADMQNRAANLPHKQVADSIEFQLMRTKLRVLNQSPSTAVTEFTDDVRDKRYADLTAAQYGLTLALMRAQKYDAAEAAYQKLRQSGRSSPIIDSLGARLKQNAGDINGALQRYHDARKRYPNYRPLVYSYADALLTAGQADNTVKLVTGIIAIHPDDYHLYQLQSRGYAQQGKDFLRHYAQAEAYAHQGNLTAAIEQLQIALKTHDGDFYQMSIAEARLKQLMAQNKADKQT